MRLESTESHLNVENRAWKLKGIFSSLLWLQAVWGTQWTG